jgi:hypothetical protein
MVVVVVVVGHNEVDLPSTLSLDRPVIRYRSLSHPVQIGRDATDLERLCA